LAFLGRWHPNKGIDILMDALVLLSNDDWSKIDEIRIYGGGPLSDYVHRIANALRRAGRPVEVGGYLDKENAGKFIAWSDFMMLPSRIESIPVIFSDAAQMKRPIIAAPVGDLPRLFERNRFGILSGGATALAFANAIREALGIGADKFAAELDAIANEFDVAAAARKVLQLARG
jgi:glycosyltransferase involved in cell wall biosynthesis